MGDELEISSIGSKKKGIYITRTSLVIYSCIIVAVLVAEGLIIGLVGRPDCDVTKITETTQATPKPTDTHTDAPTSDTPTTNAPTGAWMNIRLPLDIIPDRYNVELRPVLEPDENGKYWFYGKSSVHYKCVKTTNYVIMHATQLEITEGNLWLEMENGTYVDIKSMMFYEPNQYLVIETDPCVVGQYYNLYFITFKGELADDLRGLYRSEYYNSNGERVVIATSQMESTGARQTFPCFDEPALKAKFTVTLWYTNGFFGISNMPVNDTKTGVFDGVGYYGAVFEESVPMSTYLLAMVVCDFEYAENFTSDGIQTRIYGRPEPMAAGEAAYALKITPQILEFFANYFNVPYPLPKSDQIGVLDFGAGAMENWGLVIYREVYLLYNETISTINYKVRITEVISHELAHQWFGNLVSPAWWDEIWLNEGFATYVSYLGEVEVQPTWQSMERFVLEDLQPAFSVDDLVTSHPLVMDVSTPEEISSQFDTVSYSKGASVIRMINGFLGEENFVKGLTAYLNALQYDVATHNDLFGFWERQAETAGLVFPVDLPTILETWTLQMGFPVINVVKGPLTDAYVITQEYFLRNPDATPVHTEGSEKYGYKWYVPITYQIPSELGTDSYTLEWLEPDQQMTITEPDFLLLNYRAEGFYRVNYDRGTWERIQYELMTGNVDDIPQENRAMLLDDAFTLAGSSRLDITVPLDMSLYLSRDVSYIAWETFSNNIKYFEYMLGRTPVFGTFSNYILELVVPSLYDKFGWGEPDTSDAAFIERLTRQLGISTACYYGYKGCIGNATEQFELWMKNPDDWNIITATYRSDILCTAIRNGGAEEWDFAWERHNATSNGHWQSSIRYGLACSKDPWILNRYLEYTLDSSLIRKQDASATLSYVGSEEYGRDVAWAFLVSRWDDLEETLGSGTNYALLNSVTKRFSTDYDLQLLEDFKNSKDDLGLSANAVDLAMEKTKLNIKWRTENEEAVTNWLFDHVQNIE